MFEAGYQFRFEGRQGGTDADTVAVYRYSFRNDGRLRYIVEAHEFQDKVFVLKFYWKHHHLSSKKFSLLIGGQYAPKIIRTCAEICLDLLRRFPSASFGMIASPIEGEEKYFNKRFRIYQSVIKDWFPGTRFHHIVSEAQGGYLLINKSQPDSEQKITRTVEMFARNYQELIDEENDAASQRTAIG